mmetsp:Transcript_24715/g.44760  ORF Transcript_24715/g.44760 Transcript_24715/m.44760 type:complete len:274 (-) Transcript_24715:167-988(-)
MPRLLRSVWRDVTLLLLLLLLSVKESFLTQIVLDHGVVARGASHGISHHGLPKGPQLAHRGHCRRGHRRRGHCRRRCGRGGRCGLDRAGYGNAGGKVGAGRRSRGFGLDSSDTRRSSSSSSSWHDSDGAAQLDHLLPEFGLSFAQRLAGLLNGLLVANIVVVELVGFALFQKAAVKLADGQHDGARYLELLHLLARGVHALVQLHQRPVCLVARVSQRRPSPPAQYIRLFQRGNVLQRQRQRHLLSLRRSHHIPLQRQRRRRGIHLVYRVLAY